MRQCEVRHRLVLVSASLRERDADAKETEPGKYSTTMELSMAGDWYFVVHMTLPDGRKLERQFEIKGVRQL